MKKPRVLIIYKRSPLLAAGTSAAASSARFRSNHDQHYTTLRAVGTELKKHGLLFHQHLRGASADYASHDIIITVGGDGTFLAAARRATTQQLILGVNSDPSWSVGQFCVADMTSFPLVLARALGNSDYKKLYKLRLLFPDGNLPPVECLNDVLVCHANPAAMSRYIIRIGRQEEFQRSSGVWIASAAGSTGAIASAGGQSLLSESRHIQYRPRELYLGQGRSYSLTGAVVSSGAIEIRSRMPHGRVYCDGAHIKYPLVFGKTVRISSSPSYIRMVV